MDHSCTYLSNTRFSTNKSLSSTIHVSTFSGHRPAAEWRITTFFWRFVVNLTPTSFICPSLTFVLTMPGNGQSLSTVYDSWFYAFLLYFSSSTHSYGCSGWKPPHFSLGRSHPVYLTSLSPFPELFAALLSFWRSKEWARQPCQQGIFLRGECYCLWKRGMLTASQKMSVL